MLAIELEHLCSIDLGFEIDVLGFSMGEIDVIIDEGKETEESDAADEVPPPAASPAISRRGDLWLLKDHRLLCGDALEAASYERVMNGLEARLVLTDAPFNVKIDGFVAGKGTHHREFAMASGEMSEEQFTSFLSTALGHIATALVDGGLCFTFIDHRHIYEMMMALRNAGLKHLNLCVWDKMSGGLGSLYRSQHELVFVSKRGTALGLVPGERSTGETVRRGGITKAGNGRVRHMLVESAWTYRHPPKIGAKKLYRLEQAPPRVREIAWKAQTRLTARYRILSCRGKRTTVVCTAIARELVGFMWAVAREAQAISLSIR